MLIIMQCTCATKWPIRRIPCWRPKQLKYIIKREDALSSEVKLNSLEQYLPFSVMYIIASYSY